MIKVFRRNFFVSQCRTFCYRNPSVPCFINILVAKKFMDKRGGRVPTFSVKKFLSHIVKKTRRGTLLCCVSEIFRFRKNLWKRGGESIKSFRLKFFVSQCGKTLWWNPSVFH